MMSYVSNCSNLKITELLEFDTTAIHKLSTVYLKTYLHFATNLKNILCNDTTPLLSYIQVTNKIYTNAAQQNEDFQIEQN